MAAASALALAAQACDSGKVPEPSKAMPASTAAQAAAAPAAVAQAAAAQVAAAKAAATQAAVTSPAPTSLEPQKLPAKPVAKVSPSPGDPTQGNFTLADALKGLPAEGPLLATIQTDQEPLECELWPDKAPITVANFVGLARGLRPWKKKDTWVKEPLFNGTVFHRVVKGFMVQGGDPNKDGSGGPGYVIPDEIWEDARHDKRGLLCMANRGPNTNGSQFFITDGPTPHLDGKYTIFGKCGPDSAVEKLANSPTFGAKAVSPELRDRTVNPPKIVKVVVRRGKK